MLGYEKKESLYLKPEHLRGIFNLAGIVMPAVLLRGTVVGRWRKKVKKLTAELFCHINRRDEDVIGRAAEALWDDLSAVELKEI